MDFIWFVVGVVAVLKCGWVCYAMGFSRAWRLWDERVGDRLTPNERAEMDGEL